MTFITHHQTSNITTMTNNTFQPNRLFKLLSRNLKQNPKSWMLSIAIFAGLPLLFLVLNVAGIGINTSVTDRTTFLQLFTSAAFVFSPFILFYNYNHPKKGLTDVMLPASVLEKYIAMQISCTILAPLAVLLLFGIPDSLFALIFPKTYGGYAAPAAITDFFSWNTFSENFIIQQFILFFNLLFVRRKVLKTIGVFILALIVFLIILGIGVAIWDSPNGFSEANNVNINIGDRGIFDISVNDNPVVILMQIIRIFVQIVLPILLVIGSYFVMKNKKY